MPVACKARRQFDLTENNGNASLKEAISTRNLFSFHVTSPSKEAHNNKNSLKLVNYMEVG